MWLLVVSRSIDYWLGLSPRVNPIALVDVEVCLWHTIMCNSLSSTWKSRSDSGEHWKGGAPFLGALERGAPFFIPSVFSQHFVSLMNAQWWRKSKSPKCATPSTPNNSKSSSMPLHAFPLEILPPSSAISSLPTEPSLRPT